MGHPVVHFEIIGKNPENLRTYYSKLFGWEFDTDSPVAEAVSQPGSYGFVDRNTTSDGTGIPGGVGGGARYDSHALFYIGVPEVEAALRNAVVSVLASAASSIPRLSPSQIGECC